MIYVAGRSPAMLPVIMTLRGNVESLVILLNSWDGLKSRGH